METLKLLFFILTCCLELLFKLFEHADPAPGDLKSRLDHVLLGTDLLPECRHEKGIRQMCWWLYAEAARTEKYFALTLGTDPPWLHQ